MTDIDLDLSDFNEDEQRRILNCVKEEKAKILAQRELAQFQRYEYLNKTALLRIAADYSDWLYINGRGSSFSTFGNEFGYDSMLARPVFGFVTEILGAVQGMNVPFDALYSDVDYPKPPYAMEDEA